MPGDLTTLGTIQSWMFTSLSPSLGDFLKPIMEKARESHRGVPVAPVKMLLGAPQVFYQELKSRGHRSIRGREQREVCPS